MVVYDEILRILGGGHYEIIAPEWDDSMLPADSLERPESSPLIASASSPTPPRQLTAAQLAQLSPRIPMVMGPSYGVKKAAEKKAAEEKAAEEKAEKVKRDDDDDDDKAVEPATKKQKMGNPKPKANQSKKSAPVKAAKAVPLEPARERSARIRAQEKAPQYTFAPVEDDDE